MPLTPGEADRLLLFTQGQLARARRDRGLLLNVPEATALIADAICEWARDGLSLPDVRERASALLSERDVLPGVVDAVPEVRVEARFDDGTRLVVVPRPFGTIRDTSPSAHHPTESAERSRSVGSPALPITNEADTPIGISSHIHLAEVNPRLRLDRAAAFGHHLDIPTGETVWISAGQTVTVHLRPIAGERVLIGNTGLIDGSLDDPLTRTHALAALRTCGYLDVVDGVPINDPATAAEAVGQRMRALREDMS